MVSREEPYNEPETVKTPQMDSDLLPILFCAMKTLGGKIGVTKEQLDNFPKDFGIKFEYDAENKRLVCTCVEPRKRSILTRGGNLIVPN